MSFDLSILGNRIRDLRKKRGWSQEVLSKKAGYADKSMISRIENGSVDLSQSQIIKFAEIFDIEPGQLLSTESNDKYYMNEETAKVAQQLFENKEMRALFDAAQDATPEDLMTAYNVLLALKKKEHPDD